MADKKKPTKTAVAAPRLLELTLVAHFPSPWGNVAEEIAAIKKGRASVAAGTAVGGGWSPSTDDFNATAEADTPDPNKNISAAPNFGGVMGAIQSAPKGTLRRLNLITHASSSIIALSGTVDKTGNVTFDAANQNETLDKKRLDTNLCDYLNGKFTPGGAPDGKTIRDELRTHFHPDAEFFVYGCHAGGGVSFLILQELGLCFGIAVHGFKNFIDFDPLFDKAEKTIIRTSRARTRYEDKPVQSRDPANFARGYRHLVPDQNLPKPPTPAP